MTVIMQDYFASCPKQISELLAAELISLGAVVISIKTAGVVFQGTTETAYNICLWSRVANRILYPIKTFDAPDPDSLYAEIKLINWEDHFELHNNFKINFSSRDSEITHTQYGSQKVKDAIVDQFREKYNDRPNINLHNPDICIDIYLHKNKATVSIDLAGESLHRRGYRKSQGEAPLKENLAAALLLRAKFPDILKNNGNFVDLMCGSGTLCIEAALMAYNIAPGLYRDYFGFFKWKLFDNNLWEKLVQKAQEIKHNAINNNKHPIMITGYDSDSEAIKNALDNIALAGLDKMIHIEKRALSDINTTKISKAILSHPGLVIANPPYGERLGEAESLRYLYKNIADNFKQYFTGWKGAIFTGNPDLGKTMGLRAVNYYNLYNGMIACKLLLFDITPQYFINEKYIKNENNKTEPEVISSDDPVNMFINRLIKNKKHLAKWAKREGVSCYRLYDTDLPEYAVIIDQYEAYLHVQEYAAPKTIEPEKAQERLESIKRVLPQVMAISPEHIFYKTREKHSRESQYEKNDLIQTVKNHTQKIIVRENNCQYLINLSHYLDTGLFIDQRLIRKKIAELAHKKYFLNLFAYTGSASVLAAMQGAAKTVTVDMSATYLGWAKQNFALNGLSEKNHEFIQADCLGWVSDHTEKYDVIFVAPPTFSRSKRMEKDFDLEQDHAELLLNLAKNLHKNGTLIFATHKRNFELDSSLVQQYRIEDWSERLLPLDFDRRKNRFFCWICVKY